jgi:polygalacturonase
MNLKTILLCGASLLMLSACQNASSPAKQEISVSGENYSGYSQNVPFEMEPLLSPAIGNYKRPITDFGAIGDGHTDCSEAINTGLKEMSALGGGHLIVPRGVWMTGPIYMQNNMDLHLEEGAVLVFNPDYHVYPIINTWFEGLLTKRCASPINADSVNNIAITGAGTIDGSGDAWRWVKREKVTPFFWRDLLAKGGCCNRDSSVWYPSEIVREALSKADLNVIREELTDEQWEEYKVFLRPVMISLRNSANILLKGVRFQNSPAWNIHPLLCKNLIIDGIDVFNPDYAQNGDGLDVESCENVLILNSRFSVGDDGICIKSGKDEAGRKRGVPTRNVVVRGCTVELAHGGFVVGSEMSGGVENIYVTDCTFIGTEVGLRFKSKRGRGGVVENIHISNITMKDIVTDPILFDLHYQGLSAREVMDAGLEKVDTVAQPVNEGTPTFKDIHIENIVSCGSYRAMYFNGIAERPISNISVSNAVITSRYGIMLNLCDSVSINNVTLHVAQGEPIATQAVTNLQTDLIANN